MALDNKTLELLLKQVASGEVQLPEFQRAWKWDDDRIKSLLATVTMDYPMGVVMTLQNGGPSKFRSRALHGTPPSAAEQEPEYLLLDGQQRLTSLYQALLADRPVDTLDARGKEIQRWYYIDIGKAIDPSADREEAIVSVPADRRLREDFGRKITHDLTTVEGECTADLFPLNITFDNAKVANWQKVFVQARKDDANWDRWPKFKEVVLDRIAKYQVPMISLGKDTDKVAVCQVFEKVNTGGVSLNVFELLTATYAGDWEYYKVAEEDFDLAADWKRIRTELTERSEPLEALVNIDFLQAVSLVFTYSRRRARLAEAPGSNPPAVGCKRRDLLNLPLSEYRRLAPLVTEAFGWVGRFLRDQFVFEGKNLPYRTQLVALAAIRTILGEDADKPDIYEKLVRWYWCGVLGELYGGTVESRLPRDVEQVVAWVAGGEEPATVAEATFHEQRLATLTTRNSAAYKGIYVLLLRQGCYDWYYAERPIDFEAVASRDIDIRMIFPKAWFERSGTKDSRMMSIVNKTALSYQTNQRMGSRAPRAYLDVLARETGVGAVWLDDRVETHLINPRLLRSGDFDAFYRDRAARLLDLVDAAMGKRSVRLDAGPDF